jgi:chemotaxis protein histidine kinase CheA
MSVPISNVSRRVVLAASGTGPYSFNFEILAATDISVYRDDTLLTLTTNYTVTINTNGTGFVTLTATPTGATQIAIVGDRTIQRTSDFTTGGDLFATTLNDELDSLTIFAQQNAEAVDRALKAPQTDPTSINMTMPRASVRAGKVLSFDSNGNPAAVDYIGENRGNWSAGVAYNQRDIVKDTTNDNIYQVLTPHTSAGSLPITTNADSAKWALLVNAAAANASAVAAAASASAAATSASNASTSASNASTSASNASTSASNASTSASNASTSASNAASSASTASTAASNAQTAETNAETAETNAETAQAAAEAARDASINLATNFTATANTLSAGSSATASYNSGTYTLTLGIPTGATGSTGATGATGPEGLVWRGAYAGGTSYVIDDAVSYNGSSYICKLASTGNLPTNTTYWDILAQQGASGSGAGDVVGPASAVNDRLAAFDGTTGKLIKDSGFTAASFAKYADTTANFTGTLQNSGSNVLVASNIGSSVQAYDSNLTSFVTTFTLPTTDGTADQVLKTNGSGTLSFTTPSAGITTGKAIAMAIVFGG